MLITHVIKILLVFQSDVFLLGQKRIVIEIEKPVYSGTGFCSKPTCRLAGEEPKTYLLLHPHWHISTDFVVGCKNSITFIT
jgi:hypothetical protein